MVAFLKTSKQRMPKKTAKYYLHTHLSGYEDARSMSVLHASELTKPDGFCPKEYALFDVTKKKRNDQWLSTSERMTFQIGRDQEKNIVLWFAQMGRAYCDWKCVACGLVHPAQLHPGKCTQCGTKTLDPKEMRFVSEVSGASCGVDMVLALGNAKLDGYEIKTMDKEQFKALEGPLSEHRLRSNLYARIVSESKHPLAKKIDTSKMTVLYTTKGGYGCADPSLKALGLTDHYSPFKEYEIKRDDAETDILVAKAKAVTGFRSKETGMPHGICTSAMSKRAVSCPMKAACFSGDFPPQHDWSKT